MTWSPPAAASQALRVRLGDPGILAGLIARHQHRLYRYLYRMTRDAAAAEDLFQQTWLRVMEQARRYDPDRDFATWLFSLAHNVAVDHLRKRQPESLSEPSGDDLPPREETIAAPADALDRLLASERAGLLAAAAAELPAAYREVLALRFEEDMKLEEIAEVTRVPLPTAKSRLRRALEALRARLEGRLGREDPR